MVVPGRWFIRHRDNPQIKAFVTGATAAAGGALCGAVVVLTRQAVTEARKTVKKFIAALKHPAPGQQDFEVKKPFVQGDQVEHIWLSDVRFVGNHFEGQIDNQPRKVQGLKLGQLVSVKPKEISDWLYIDNGKLVGGYTVRAHYNELSPQQKREFDRDADFKMEQP